jgi:protocatechuate 3,4-dioxygenase beta subunit
MRRIPEPHHTPAGPAYEGRLLDRAEEEVVDQGVRFDIGTLVSRRGLLGLVAAGAGTVVLAACTPGGADAPSPHATPAATGATPAGVEADAELPSAEIPQETAGPYPGDGSNGPDVLERTGIVRSDIRSSVGGGASAAGVALVLRLTILDMANGDRGFAGVAVYVWHCDGQGRYSMYSDGIEDETYLRGVQVADSDGVVTFSTIFPGCYQGRWPHIHFEVYPSAEAITDSTSAIATSQVALPQAACAQVYATSGYEGSTENLSRVSLTSDGVFGDDGGALELAAVGGDAGAGMTAALTVRVDTATAATSGGMGGAPGRP